MSMYRGFRLALISLRDAFMRSRLYLRSNREARCGAVASLCFIGIGLGCKASANVGDDRGFGRSVLIEGVPHVRQKPDFCGEADVEMYLRFRGHTITQDQVFDVSGMDPARGKGLTTSELAIALTRLGFDPGDVWYQVSPATAGRELAELWRAVVRDLEANIPSIVCMNTSLGANSSEHFRLILGYDAKRDEVIYHEPAEADGAYRRISRARFFRLWPLKYAESQWSVVRLRLDTDEIRKVPPTKGLAPSAFVQHVMRLRQGLSKRYTVVVEPPFVVLGNGAPEDVHRYAKETVGWAVRKLHQDFFPRDPPRILDVWLLRDDASYRKVAEWLTGEDPDTPYGFYSPDIDALIMNIASPGARDRSSLHGGQLPQVPLVVQRRAWLALRALQRTTRSHRRAAQLAAAATAGCHPHGHRAQLPRADPADREELLRRSLRPPLRPGPLSPLRAPGEGPPHQVLPSPPPAPEGRSDRLPSARQGARRDGSGQVPAPLGKRHAEAVGR